MYWISNIDSCIQSLSFFIRLIKASYQYAIANGYAGLYTVGQDNNLNACLFYLACGFEIGGLDTKIYENTKQSGKFDITFYMH